MNQRIFLMTDFGTRDGYPAAMKGVIWSLCPRAEVVDLTHEIPPQDILAGALTLGRTAPYAPPGTIFVAVVDPGVGSARRALAARLGEHFFIAPDNGLLSVVLAQAEGAGGPLEWVQLNRPRFWRVPPRHPLRGPVGAGGVAAPGPRQGGAAPLSHTFHGRDLFAPVAAHLANGVALAELGDPVTDPVRLPLPAPRRLVHGWQGQVIHVDTFGNLATNLMVEHLPEAGEVEVCIAGEYILRLVQTFAERPPGALVALIDSAGALSIAVVNGNAAAHLKAGVGCGVELNWTPDKSETVND